MATHSHTAHLDSGQMVFTRILVGIDGSRESLEAARQAALLHDGDAQLVLLVAWDVVPVLAGGPRAADRYDLDVARKQRSAEDAIRAACACVSPSATATGRVVRGKAVNELLSEAERDEDTLIAIGSSGTGRLRGILEGDVATEIVHHSPCSVLVARPAKNTPPRCIVTGVDGSVESAAAYATARYLAERFDAELEALVAWHDRGIDERLVRAITAGEQRDSPGSPKDTLVEASKRADLLVVGSRGVHGVRALGSVSERVAHKAACSTLIVREPEWRRIADELAP